MTHPNSLGEHTNRTKEDSRLPRIVVAWIVLMAAIVVVALTASMALAKKPVRPPEPPAAQPACDTVRTLGGAGVFVEYRCDWTPGNTGSDEIGTVKVTEIIGEVSSVVVFVRDSAPGDICVLEQWGKAIGTEWVASFPLVYDQSSYWDLGGVNWCESFDPVAGQREDLNGEPLDLSVSIRGKKGFVVEISVAPGQEDL